MVVEDVMSSSLSTFAQEIGDSEHWLSPAGLLAELDVRPGVTVGEIGAGKAFYTLPIGRRVGPAGRVFAVEWRPWVIDALRKVNERVLSGKAAFPPQVSCWPLGVPAFVLYPAQPIYFIQTPTEVLMTWQADHMVRRVLLTDRHSANPTPSWFGESIGHYENGDTLVIDTIGLNTRTFVDNYRTPHTDKLHVVERFKLARDAKTIEVTVTIDDSGAFTTPWSAMQRYRRVEPGPMLEASCAEGNFNYFNLDMEPMPQADKQDF